MSGDIYEDEEHPNEDIRAQLAEDRRLIDLRARRRRAEAEGDWLRVMSFSKQIHLIDQGWVIW